MIKKAYHIIFKRNFLLPVILIIGFVVFRRPIELLFSKTIVKYVLSEVDSVWYIDLIFLFIIILVIVFVVYNFRRYVPSRNLSVLLSILSIIYLMYRFTCTIWNFTPFSIWSVFNYADILLVIFICHFFIFKKEKNKETVNGINSFYEDSPLGLTEKDLLGYTSYAKLLSERILSSNFTKAFAIGINGKWGLGKTSFFDLLKRELESDDIIEVNFKAWNSQSPEAIIKDFFETFQESIRPYHFSFSRLLTRYSNKLIKLNSNNITQSIQTTISTITGFETLNSLYDDINDALEQINKKIVIYIDDLDRLDKNEIMEVIRLIRNTANFYQTFFIVAYDRNYVVNALKQFNTYRKEEFLEKIFQIEISLPYFNKDVLRYNLAKKLKSKLPDEIHSKIDNEVIDPNSLVAVCLNEWLSSMRDVTRLANAIILNLEKLIGEIELGDFIRIELLRMKYPTVYELLYRRTLEFLDTSLIPSTQENYYKLKRIKEKVDDKENEQMVAHTCLGKYLIENYDTELSIPKNEISKIFNLVNGIFNPNYSLNFNPSLTLSIIYPSKFNRYFAYKLLEGSLSEIEFSKARSLNQDEFNTKIAQWVSEELELELKRKFNGTHLFDNQEDFEKIIAAIFYFAKLQTKFPNDYSMLVGYSSEDLMVKIINYTNTLNSEQKVELNRFLKRQFKQAKIPYTFESNFVRYINSESSNDFILTDEELKEINLDYFKKYCDAIKSFDSNVWNLFHNCKQTKWVDVGNNSNIKQDYYPDEAKDIMKDFVLNKGLDGFIRSIIKKHYRSQYFSVSNIVIELFGDWETFEKRLSSLEDESFKYLNEFKEFLRVFASKDYSQYVEFNFKNIPVEK